jgi:hypothetical protein
MYETSSHPGNRAGRGLSHNLWAPARIPVEQIMLGNLTEGFGFFDDFGDLPTGRHTATQATAGTYALDTAKSRGVVLADCNSATATQGINVQRPGHLFQLNANIVTCFEARVAAADIATGPEFFLGLHILNTAIIATSAMAAASSDWIGFKSVTDNNVLLATTSDNATETTAASIHTFVDHDTSPTTAFVKLGFRVNGTTGVEFFVNGLKVAAITTTLPATSALLLPSLVCQSGGTTDPIIHKDWWACFSKDTLLGTLA